MCRWLAYSGSPIVLSRALYTSVHSAVAVIRDEMLAEGGAIERDVEKFA